MKVIKMLDAFCCAGGAAVGYVRAFEKKGYQVEILGIDIQDQPEYPFPFLKCDAVAYLKNMLLGDIPRVDFIHTSPPCQKYSVTKNIHKRDLLPDYVPAVRQLLKQLEIPAVIENVAGSPLFPDLMLEGHLFGLGVKRKRLFEFINWFSLVTEITGTRESVAKGDFITVAGNGCRYSADKTNRDYKKWRGGVIDTWREAMGIDWMTNKKSLANAIPPAYTEYIGALLLENIEHQNYLKV